MACGRGSDAFDIFLPEATKTLFVRELLRNKAVMPADASSAAENELIVSFNDPKVAFSKKSGWATFLTNIFAGDTFDASENFSLHKRLLCRLSSGFNFNNKIFIK